MVSLQLIHCFHMPSSSFSNPLQLRRVFLQDTNAVFRLDALSHPAKYLFTRTARAGHLNFRLAVLRNTLLSHRFRCAEPLTVCFNRPKGSSSLHTDYLNVPSSPMFNTFVSVTRPMSRQLVLPLWVTGLRKNDSVTDPAKPFFALLQSRG